jgi:hypothetical protein
MANPSGIRAGAVYVEITADDSPMQARLAQSQARLKAWVAENSGSVMTRGTEAGVLAGAEGGGRGFFSGTFRSAEMFGGAIRFVGAIQMARVALADVRIFSDLVRGDFEGMRKAAEALPFGLGEVVKQLSGPVDAAFKALLVGNLGDVYDKAAIQKARQDRQEEVDQYNRDLQAVAAAQKRLRETQLSMLSPRERAVAEAEDLGASARAKQQVVAANLAAVALKEEKAAAEEKARAAKEYAGLLTRELDEHAKLTMSEEEYIAYQVRHLGLTEDQQKSILSWRLENLRITKEQKAAEEAAKEAARQAAEAERERNRELQDAYDLSLRRLEATQREAESITRSVETPEERFRREKERLDELREYGEESGYGISDETYNRAIRKALEDAAAAMPDTVSRATIGVRGTFNALQAAGLGAGGASDRLTSASERTAKNTDKIAKLAEQWGVTFN